jgi:hypothetical protein
MLTLNHFLPGIGRALAVTVMLFSSSGIASAVTYDFDRIVTGGAKRANPQEQEFIRRAGSYICVDVRESTTPPANRVLFIVWSNVPQLKSRITAIAIDTGRHADLFTGVSILVRSPGLNPQIIPSKGHAFLRTLSPDYYVSFPYPEGLAPGNSIVLAATLGSGKTFANVLSAMNEGLNPATASTGLRLGVVATKLLGGPPPGVATISDDGGWVTNGVSSRCQRR